MRIELLPLFACIALIGCGDGTTTVPKTAIDIDPIARDYLFLELSMGRHDSGHVDAYFGPANIRDAANEAALSLDEIRERAHTMSAQLEREQDGEPDAMRARRIAGLLARLEALDTRIRLNQGETLPFDTESELLFGARAPEHDAAYFEEIIEEIDALLPGEGPLPERVNAFRDRFLVPPDSLPAVFDAAIAECRRRTLEHIALPEHESFTLEYVSNQPWSGYNWYQGNAQSLIQVNTDLPVFVSRAVDLGCHEGYPGHHTYNTLLEQNVVDGLGWIEFSLYPLFSPQSLIAEGSGNYGIDLAFPGDERVAFEREVLFPLAGLDAAEADRYYELLGLMARLNFAGNEAARDYLNGEISREEAVQWLVDYSLTSPERARQSTDFFDAYRSYVINYNLGKDQVRAWVERDSADQAGRWARFRTMLSSPLLPSDLR